MSNYYNTPSNHCISNANNKNDKNRQCFNPCSDILTLATLACKLSSFLSDEELELLSANLVMFGDILADISVRRSICCGNNENVDSSNPEIE